MYICTHICFYEGVHYPAYALLIYIYIYLYIELYIYTHTQARAAGVVYTRSEGMGRQPVPDLKVYS